MSADLTKTNLKDISELLQEKKISSAELCSLYLDRCRKFEEKIHAFTWLDENDIIIQANACDKRRAEGAALSSFDGIPIAIKDNIAVEGQPCTCASKILKPFKSPYDATVAERLKAKGFVFFGRTNMDEFAMGSSCENSALFKTANPWNTGYVPGGSSGGSAAAVAAREVPVALGSDTGGSIRQPASFCGIVGFKPTYGCVSRYGLVAFASSLDQIGPMANSVGDAAVLFDIIGGHDPKDSTSLKNKKLEFDASLGRNVNLSGVRIGIPKEYFEAEGLDSEVRNTIEKNIKIFEQLGAELVEISLPHTKYAVATYYVIATAEASANLARYDGIRYGARVKSNDLLETYLESRGRGFGDEVKRRILLGTFVLSSGYYDAYYLKAQKVRTLIRRDFENAFAKCDIMASPVSPTTAFRFGEKSDPLQMYLADIYTIAVNLAGICAISVPAGLHENTGLPVGLQLTGPALEEEKLLRISRIFEANREIKEFIPSLQ